MRRRSNRSNVDHALTISGDWHCRRTSDTNRQSRDLQQRTFDENAQIRNTQKVLAGIELVQRNPNLLQSIGGELVDDGVLNPEVLPQLSQMAQTNPQQFSAALDEFKGQLQFQLGQVPQDKLTTNQSDFRFAQNNPEFAEFLRGNSNAPVVNIDTGKAQTAEQITAAEAAKGRGQASVQLRSEIRDAGKAGRANINQISRFRQLSTNTKTGAFEPTINRFRAVGSALGLNIDEERLAAGEGIQALAVPFTLQIAQQTKGPISDREMALFASAVPGLATSELGNAFILEGMERVAQRQVDIDRLATEYVREHGILDAGWDAFVSDWETQNPLFDDGEVSLMESALSGQDPGQSGAVTTNTGGTIDFSQLPVD